MKTGDTATHLDRRGLDGTRELAGSNRPTVPGLRCAEHIASVDLVWEDRSDKGTGYDDTRAATVIGRGRSRCRVRPVTFSRFLRNPDPSEPRGSLTCESRVTHGCEYSSEDGAPESTLEAIEPLLSQAHSVGETMAAIANSAGVLYIAHLPELPDHDVAVVGALPHLVPLIASRQRKLQHLVVAIDRVGAEIVAVLPDRPDRQLNGAGNEFHVTRSAAGGWSQRRFQQRAANQWEANARLAADELVRRADTTDARLIVISGDVRAVGFLREHLPKRVTSLLAEVQGDYGSVDEALAVLRTPRARPFVTFHSPQPGTKDEPGPGGHAHPTQT